MTSTRHLIRHYNIIMAELPALSPTAAMTLARAKLIEPKVSKVGYAIRGHGVINATERKNEGWKRGRR